jgi:hypothetical protein
MFFHHEEKVDHPFFSVLSALIIETGALNPFRRGWS